MPITFLTNEDKTIIDQNIAQLSEEINNIPDPPDVSAFITRAVNDLENYYRKGETYTREEIDGRISAIPKFSIAVVNVLPTDVISETTIYLVPSGVDGNLYTEYIYVNGSWEILGAQRVDLTGYATQTWTLQQLAGYQPKGNYLTEHQDISGKLDANKLPEAVNTALAQAKASGEFDGANGDNGLDGVSPTVSISKSGKVTTISITDKNGTKTATVNDGADGSAGSAGKDGTSVTVKSVSESTADGGSNVVTFSDGKTLTVKNGTKGNTGATGATGPAGKTPVKGVDYFTPADQEAIVQDVIAALGTPVFGTVDANKHITLSGHLVDGTYTMSFEDTDGTVIELCEIEKGGVLTIPLTFTKGKIDSSSGNISGNGTDNTYFYSNAVEVEEGYTYSVHVSAGLNTTAKAVFWDESGGFMSSATLALWADASATGITSEADYAIPIPIGAASFRIRAYNFAYSSAELATASLLATQNGVVLTAEKEKA